ncbi:hypothetical protein BD413DRAFT_527886 [Trametes elegans]|nr:hypothetical protein BD413DRAFT_527886 [Trametes elegans]
MSVRGGETCRASGTETSNNRVQVRRLRRRPRVRTLQYVHNHVGCTATHRSVPDMYSTVHASGTVLPLTMCAQHGVRVTRGHPHLPPAAVSKRTPRRPDPPVRRVHAVLTVRVDSADGKSALARPQRAPLSTGVKLATVGLWGARLFPPARSLYSTTRCTRGRRSAAAAAAARRPTARPPDGSKTAPAPAPASHSRVRADPPT